MRRILISTKTSIGKKVAFKSLENPKSVATADIKTSPTDRAAVPASVAKKPELNVLFFFLTQNNKQTKENLENKESKIDFPPSQIHRVTDTHTSQMGFLPYLPFRPRRRDSFGQ